MMYRYEGGDGAWMMTMLPFTWLVLIGLIVWLAVRFSHGSATHPDHSSTSRSPRETPEEILDRRFAAGEIDAEAHAAARHHLQEHPRA